jgi:hypothetical protein
MIKTHVYVKKIVRSSSSVVIGVVKEGESCRSMGTMICKHENGTVVTG